MKAVFDGYDDGYDKQDGGEFLPQGQWGSMIGAIGRGDDSEEENAEDENDDGACPEDNVAWWDGIGQKAAQNDVEQGR